MLGFLTGLYPVGFEGRIHYTFVVLDAEDSSFVVDVNGEELSVKSYHVMPAPRPWTPEETPHPFMDGLEKPERKPTVSDEYVIDRLLGIRRTNDAFSAKVRWFDYGPKDNFWEPSDLPRNLVIRYPPQKKRIAGYSWSVHTPPSRGTCRFPRLNKVETALVVTPQGPAPNWSPTLCRVF